MRIIELAGPADDDLLSTVRLLSASLGSQAGMAVDSLDELCLAVEEACSALVLAGAPRLLLSFVLDDDIRVTARACQPQALAITDASRVVITSLTDGYDVDHADGAIHLVKHVG